MCDNKDSSSSKQPARESQSISSKQLQQKDYDAWSDIPKVDADEVISKEASLILLNELNSFSDKRVPTTVDHKKMEATLKDMLSNQFRNAEEYAYHVEKSKNYMENQMSGNNRNTEEKKYVLSLHKIHATPFPEDDLEERLTIWLGIKSYQIKINLTAPTLTILGIKNLALYSTTDEPFVGVVYENNKKEKRVMRLLDIPKFYDATLERVLKEVSLIVFEARYKLNNISLGELDKYILELMEK
ncbi:hypothetical protein Tco_0649929 [Tanacetum coccineum]